MSNYLQHGFFISVLEAVVLLYILHDLLLIGLWKGTYGFLWLPMSAADACCCAFGCLPDSSHQMGISVMVSVPPLPLLPSCIWINVSSFKCFVVSVAWIIEESSLLIRHFFQIDDNTAVQQEILCAHLFVLLLCICMSVYSCGL